MAKHYRKITAAMQARLGVHGPGTRRPGSQNRKKCGWVKAPKR